MQPRYLIRDRPCPHPRRPTLYWTSGTSATSFTRTTLGFPEQARRARAGPVRYVEICRRRTGHYRLHAAGGAGKVLPIVQDRFPGRLTRMRFDLKPRSPPKVNLDGDYREQIPRRMWMQLQHARHFWTLWKRRRPITDHTNAHITLDDPPGFHILTN